MNNAEIIAKGHGVGTVKVYATHGHFTNEHAPSMVSFQSTFLTYEDRDAFAALFPKSARWIATHILTHDNGDYRTGNAVQLPYATVTIHLVANGVNGGVNETGIKRYRSIVKVIEQAGIPIDYRTPYGNSYASLAELDAAIEQASARLKAAA